MALFSKKPKFSTLNLAPRVKEPEAVKRKHIPEGLWEKCRNCDATIFTKQKEANLYICPSCGKYMPIGAKERLAMVLDEASFEPWFEEVGICDPLGTPGYPEKLAAAQKKSGSTEAVTIG